MAFKYLQLIQRREEEGREREGEKDRERWFNEFKLLIISASNHASSQSDKAALSQALPLFANKWHSFGLPIMSPRKTLSK